MRTERQKAEREQRKAVREYKAAREAYDRSGEEVDSGALDPNMGTPISVWKPDEETASTLRAAEEQLIAAYIGRGGLTHVKRTGQYNIALELAVKNLVTP